MKLSKKIKDTCTGIAHFIGGVLTAFASVCIPVLAVLLTSLFVIYEMDESWHINDEAFRDIKVYLVGAFVGAILIVLKAI